MSAYLFGVTRGLTEAELQFLKRLVVEAPSEVFAALNKHLNGIGLCLHVERLDGEEVK